MPRATVNSFLFMRQSSSTVPRSALPTGRYTVSLVSVLILLLLSTSASALRSDRQQPINIVADTSEVDAKTGYTRITGGVVITQGSLIVNADEARVYVVEGRVNRVELDGGPATWKQSLESGDRMDARAQHIDYRVPDGVIELTGNALVNHPQGEISGASLQYELDTEKLRGFSQNGPGGDRVRIRIEPDAVDSGGLLEGVGGNRNSGNQGGGNQGATNSNGADEQAVDEQSDDDGGNGLPSNGTPSSGTTPASTED